MKESVVIHELCDTLEEFAANGELLDMVVHIVDDWLSNKEMSSQMLVSRFLLAFGEKGEKIALLLTGPLTEVIMLMDKCLETSENKVGIYRARTLVAKYHPLIYFERRKRSSPNLTNTLRAMPVNKEPVVIRIEAELSSGKRTILEIDMDDVGEILDAVKEASREELQNLLTRFLDAFGESEEECKERDEENDVTSKRVTMNRCRIITSI